MKRDAAAQPLVGGEECLHLLRVAGEDDDHIRAAVFHLLHDGVDCLVPIAAGAVAHERVRFIDEEDAAVLIRTVGLGLQCVPIQFLMNLVNVRGAEGMPLSERLLQFARTVVGHRRLSVELLQVRDCLRAAARALFDVYEGDVFLQGGQKFFHCSRLRMELHKDEERVALIFADDLSEIFDNALIASCIVFFLVAAAAHFNDDDPSLRMVQKMFEILLLKTGVFNAMNAVDPLPHKALVSVKGTREKDRHRHRRL